MTKKKTAKKKKPQKPRRKSVALNNYPATMTDFGQFFNPESMEDLMTKGKTQFDKLTNDANAMGRDGFDAFNKSMSIFTKGFEDLMRATISIAQSATEKQGQLVKEAMSSKSLNEWADIQSRIAQSTFDDCIAAATKLSEMSVKLMTASSEPINSQLTKGMKKASEAMAA